MKISRTTYAVIALIALLPASTFSKKDASFRVFRTTRAKAGKATKTDASISPSPVPYSYPGATTAGSKASKEPVGAKVLKDFLPSKAGKTKCQKEDSDLSEFDLILDLSSFSMSSSMAYSMPMGSKASKAMTKCYKFPESTKSSKTSLDITDNDLSLGDDDYWSFDDDDDWRLNGDDIIDDVTLLIRFFLEQLSICDGTTLDFDSCLVENLITVIANPSGDESTRVLRAANNSPASRAMQSVELAGDDWQVTTECTLPSEDEIKIVVDQATRMCVDSGVQISGDEYNAVLNSFLGIFANEVCVCV
ncbi:hypothetical protein HJC23_013517 [Cyclotella cryptica]|uniref:Uncharacterized protein n=1 Tax=Cyclotella cryptica TaxID=29204 RepID=A0ABD3P176_9STRA|eukprot:CCRYP_019210-RA/>CCRYP_019210-RA protein AED:0.09 eAED:0.09 QI:150/1/1/1/0/0/2/82/304